MAVSYILIRPPQLPELGDPSDAFIVGYDPTTDKTVKIKVANIGGGSVSPPLDISWKSNVEYSSGEIVEYGLRLWKSLQGINEGNFPTEGIWWTEVARGNQSITYWTAGVYTKDPTIKLVNNIFYLLDAALPFESVNFTNELASGDWVAIGGGGGGGGGGHTILDPAGDTMPTQPALQFGAGFTVTDEVDKTVVGIEYVQPISFAITDKFTFKPAYALSITSADVSSNITDLRVGKNGATPTTITYPYAVLATDILTFEVTFTDAYNRELNSFITLIGQYL